MIYFDDGDDDDNDNDDRGDEDGDDDDDDDDDDEDNKGGVDRSDEGIFLLMLGVVSRLFKQDLVPKLRLRMFSDEE